MNGWAIKDGNGEIDIGSLQGTFEDAWDEWLQGRQITTQKGAEAEGYTCVYVVIQEAGSGEAIQLDCYDAGYLNDYGGGNVQWWQDYIRAELGHAHAFYQSQLDSYPPASAGMVDWQHPTIAECEAAGRGPEGPRKSGEPYKEGGLPNTPEERARFEAYMRGHCWEAGAYSEVIHAYDSTLVRMLYGVWRDRGALAMLAAAKGRP